MTCKGICVQYKANTRPHTGSRYNDGQKYCRQCQEFVIWDGIRCPCCCYKLRSRPNNTHNKKLWREGKVVVQ